MHPSFLVGDFCFGELILALVKVRFEVGEFVLEALDLLVSLEGLLLQCLHLGLCVLCALRIGVGFGTQGSEFLFVNVPGKDGSVR
jgi:hypothetical protein